MQRAARFATGVEWRGTSSNSVPGSQAAPRIYEHPYNCGPSSGGGCPERGAQNIKSEAVKVGLGWGVPGCGGTDEQLSINICA